MCGEKRAMSEVIILGLESSCDETAAAVVVDGQRVLSNSVASQIELHRRFGGVVPEIAARAHIENIIPVIRQALEESSVTADQLSAIAVGASPGLTPALIIAVTAAKTLAWSWSKPLIAVNHIHSHLQSVMLDQMDECFPAVALVVSGGHTSIYNCRNPLDLELIGCTIDDAAGEAFDKVATILHLPYPGGPSIEKAAKEGNPKAINFPRTYFNRDSLDFSFSGLKTAVLYHCRGQDMLGKDRAGDMTQQEIADIAASFQAAVVDVLTKKILRAAQQTNAKTVLLGGGVAANTALRNQLEKKCQSAALKLLIAQKKYCTDNAAMIAGLAYHKFKAKEFADYFLEPKANDQGSQQRIKTKRQLKKTKKNTDK